MNILVFSWRDPKHPLAGGAEQVMHEHMKGWLKAGHKVTLFASQQSRLSEKETLDGIDIIRTGYQYSGVQVAGFFYYLKNKDRFDLVVDQFHGLPFLTPLYIRKPKLAVVQETARNVWFLNPLPWPLNWLAGTAGFLLEPVIFLLYKGIFFMTGSESAKRDVAKFGIPKSNITVVPHGLIIVRPTPFPKRETNHTIVYLGTLSKDKGVEDALRCFALLKTIWVSDWQFWVIGKPETVSYYRKLKALTKALGLGNKVKFWGYADQKKKFELLARAHILVNPSVHEGWGLVNIEANSMGTPVVSYRSQGLVDSVSSGQSGVFTKKNTPQSLAETVILVLSNKQKYKALQKGAVVWSKKFSWEKSVALSLKLIEKVMMN